MCAAPRLSFRRPGGPQERNQGIVGTCLPSTARTLLAQAYLARTVLCDRRLLPKEGL